MPGPCGGSTAWTRRRSRSWSRREGSGSGPVEHIIQALSGLTHPAQVVVVCGRNEELRDRLARVGPEARQASSGVAFTLLGFTTEMDELMAAADLFVGKPGGLTTSEALAKGLPMVVINPIPGQEERNSDHLLEEGIAIRCNNLPALAYKIDRLIDEPGKLMLMRGNALALGKPQAAFTILERLDGLRHRTAPANWPPTVSLSPRAVARPRRKLRFTRATVRWEARSRSLIQSMPTR